MYSGDPRGGGGELCEVSGGVEVEQAGRQASESETGRKRKRKRRGRWMFVGQSSVKLGAWIPGYLDSRLKGCAIG